jgi:hypothetical protein
LPIFKKDCVTIHYEEAGSGTPLLVLPGGGLNATIAGLASHAFNPLEEFSDNYRVIALDLRNANTGNTDGPLGIERTWDELHPIVYTSSHPTIYYDNNISGWAPQFIKRHPEITIEMTSDFLNNMYTTRADFVFTVDRDFVRNCQTPILVLPDDIPAHPYATAMETALLAPNAQVSLYPWKENNRKIELAVRHIRGFMNNNT